MSFYNVVNFYSVCIVRYYERRRLPVSFAFDGLKRTSLWESLETLLNCLFISCNVYPPLMFLVILHSQS